MLTEYPLQGLIRLCPESLVPLHDGFSRRGEDRTAARHTANLSFHNLETQFLFDVSQKTPRLAIRDAVLSGGLTQRTCLLDPL